MCVRGETCCLLLPKDLLFHIPQSHRNVKVNVKSGQITVTQQLIRFKVCRHLAYDKNVVSNWCRMGKLKVSSQVMLA